MNDDLQWEHWTDKWPTTNGGKPRWRTVIKKSAERLVELLEAHGISEHSCQICPNQHGMWANHLGGPKHYSHLYNGPNLKILRSSGIRLGTCQMYVALALSEGWAD